MPSSAAVVTRIIHQQENKGRPHANFCGVGESIGLESKTAFAE